MPSRQADKACCEGIADNSMDIFAYYLIVYAVVWYTCFAGSVSAGQSLAETDQFFMRKAMLLIR